MQPIPLHEYKAHLRRNHVPSVSISTSYTQQQLQLVLYTLYYLPCQHSAQHLVFHVLDNT